MNVQALVIGKYFWEKVKGLAFFFGNMINKTAKVRNN